MSEESATAGPTTGGETELTHLDAQGRVRMVDVSAKAATLREAQAEGWVRMRPETFAMICEGRAKKGNVLEAARIAGVMGAKRTAALIPMCHPLALTHLVVDFYPDAAGSAFRIAATARTLGPTGVEMEALTAVAVAALTIYDMCKAVDREMSLDQIRLIRKSGGKSGTYVRS
jgi:cyclic pyranopterin phosphate synthase